MLLPQWSNYSRQNTGLTTAENECTLFWEHNQTHQLLHCSPHLDRGLVLLQLLSYSYNRQQTHQEQKGQSGVKRMQPVLG